MKKLIFYVNNFLGSGDFLIQDVEENIQKCPESKKILYPKISSVRPISRAKEFLKYVLYFQTFLQELQMAAGNPILRIDV